MTRYTVSTAAPHNAGVPCRLHAEHGLGRCGQPVRFVVDVFDMDEDFGDTGPRHVRQFGACDDHADLYR